MFTPRQNTRATFHEFLRSEVHVDFTSFYRCYFTLRHTKIFFSISAMFSKPLVNELVVLFAPFVLRVFCLKWRVREHVQEFYLVVRLRIYSHILPFFILLCSQVVSFILLPLILLQPKGRTFIGYKPKRNGLFRFQFEDKRKTIPRWR